MLVAQCMNSNNAKWYKRNERIVTWNGYNCGSFMGWPLLTGSILDWIFGDPYHFPHMIRLMGKYDKRIGEEIAKTFS